MRPVFYYYVRIPETGFSATLIGGPLKPSRTAGYVILTSPNGEPFMEVKRQYVRPSNQRELAERIRMDRQAAKAPWN